MQNLLAVWRMKEMVRFSVFSTSFYEIILNPPPQKNKNKNKNQKKVSHVTMVVRTVGPKSILGTMIWSFFYAFFAWEVPVL